MKYFLSVVAALGLTTSAFADVANGIYRGSSQTTVKFLDPVTLQVQATRRFSRKLTVTIGPPLGYGGTTESSPFHFSVAPTNYSGTPVAGDLFTASARTAIVQGRPRLLQYWLMQNNQSGFTGALINSHLLEGAQRDRLVAPLSAPNGPLKPYRLYDGSVAPGFQVTANALVNGKEMTLTVLGYAYLKTQAIISFQTTITANRR